MKSRTAKEVLLSRKTREVISVSSSQTASVFLLDWMVDCVGLSSCIGGPTPVTDGLFSWTLGQAKCFYIFVMQIAPVQSVSKGKLLSSESH